MIRIERTKLAYRVSLNFEHQDERGRILQPFNAGAWEEAARGWPELPLAWRQENVVVERFGVVRGLHTDYKSWKLASCLHGKVRLGLLDTRTMETEVVDLGLTRFPTVQVLIPPWVANGHAVLSTIAVFHYLWSRDYEPQSAFRWDGYGIDWGVGEPVLSERDR